jgi:hypothetical protein
MQPVYKIQQDENGLNVIDPVTGHPVWLPQTTTVFVDPTTGLVHVPSAPSADGSPVDQSTLIATEIPLLEPKYKMRYLTSSGDEMTKDEYDAAKAQDALAPVYRAALVGCTYHSG